MYELSCPSKSIASLLALSSQCCTKRSLVEDLTSTRNASGLSSSLSTPKIAPSESAIHSSGVVPLTGGVVGIGVIFCRVLACKCSIPGIVIL